MLGRVWHTQAMETYTIIPRGGTYSVVATGEDEKRRLIAACPTEQAAVALLRRLQEKVGVAAPEQRRSRDWRP